MSEPDNRKFYFILTAALAVALIAGGFFLFSLPANDYSFFKPGRSSKIQEAATETNVLFTGDIMLSRNVGSKINQANNPYLPFANVSQWLTKSNLVFGNLESPFLNKGPRVTEGMVFKAEPEWVVGLKDFTVLQTANNHAWDRGQAGLEYTNKLLSDNEILPVGTGSDCSKGTIIERNGIKFGFLAYSYAGYNDGGRNLNPQVCDWNNQAAVIKNIQAMRPQVDVLIVAPHMGTEYKRLPNATDAARARAAIEAGADFVIGTHPHWMQTVEYYQGKWIFYSLGNFIFDQMWRQDTREGMAVQAIFKGHTLDKLQILPAVIDNYCCPRPANLGETTEIIKKINPKAQSGVLLENGQAKPDWANQ